jgi:hypothetical protein
MEQGEKDVISRQNRNQKKGRRREKKRGDRIILKRKERDKEDIGKKGYED